MAASSKCGESTTMRAKAAGSTSPQVGSTKVSGTSGSYGDVVDLARHVVAEGRFDREWKLPADAAAKLAATGTVNVKPF